MRKSSKWLITATLVATALSGCNKSNDTAVSEETGPVVAEDEAGQRTPELRDVIETTPSYVVGISYDKELAVPPAFLQVIEDHAAGLRNELIESVAVLGNDTPTAPYELSLHFAQTVDTPQLKAVSADGSLYTGGAHGKPLVARYVWLVPEATLLTPSTLIPDPKSRQAIAKLIQERLIAELDRRLDAEDFTPEERENYRRTQLEMIHDGTTPVPENFSEFQPLLNADGKIRALRFVFPPYQVGPYSDGTQHVDVQANELHGQIAPQYVSLFEALAE